MVINIARFGGINFVIAMIWQAQARESVVSFRLVKMQDEVISLMLQARNLMLPNMGYLKQYVFFY